MRHCLHCLRNSQFAIVPFQSHSLNAIQRAQQWQPHAKEWRPRTIHPPKEWRGASKFAIVLKTILDLNFASSQVRGGFSPNSRIQRADGQRFLPSE
jgi:hypothetical protein